MGTLRSILVPVDGSRPSLAALDHALALATDYGATIEVLHVIPADDPMSSAARAELEREMDVAVDHARSASAIPIEARSVRGDAVVSIIEAARMGIDLIVMGTHGRSGRIHSMLGSVAEGVVRNAPCPVLTVRDPSPGYESFAERRHPGRPSIAEQTRAR